MAEETLPGSARSARSLPAPTTAGRPPPACSISRPATRVPLSPGYPLPRSSRAGSCSARGARRAVRVGRQPPHQVVGILAVRPVQEVPKVLVLPLAEARRARASLVVPPLRPARSGALPRPPSRSDPPSLRRASAARFAGCWLAWAIFCGLTNIAASRFLVGKCYVKSAGDLGHGTTEAGQRPFRSRREKSRQVTPGASAPHSVSQIGFGGATSIRLSSTLG